MSVMWSLEQGKQNFSGIGVFFYPMFANWVPTITILAGVKYFSKIAKKAKVRKNAKNAEKQKIAKMQIVQNLQEMHRKQRL